MDETKPKKRGGPRGASPATVIGIVVLLAALGAAWPGDGEDWTVGRLLRVLAAAGIAVWLAVQHIWEHEP